MKKPILILIITFLIFGSKAQGQFSYQSVNTLDSSYILPKFPGGINGFTKYITDNQKYVRIFDYPLESLSIPVSCHIEKDGQLTHIKLNKTKCPDCDSEVIRLLKLSPKWQPALHNGKPTSVKMLLSVTLQVNYADHGDPVIWTNLKTTKSVYPAPDKEPNYPDGIEKFIVFIKGKMNVPSNYFNVQGKVFVTFVVEKNGKLTHIQVLRSPHPTLSEEVLKAVHKSPRWIPGIIRDTAVRTQYTVAISFP